MRREKSLVTIITVTYNSSKYLERCFKSVFSQTYTNIEYIVIDGGSTDGTVDLIKQYESKIKYWISEPDKGIYEAMNKGLKEANGKIIHFLNSDDYFCDNNVVRDVVRSFNENPEVDLIYGYVIKLIDELNMKFETRCSVNRKNLIKPRSLPQQAFFYKKEIFERLGDFDISYKGSGDYEYLCRMYTNGVKMKEIDRSIVYFKKGGISSKVSEGHRSLKKYFGLKYAIWFYIKSRVKLFVIFLLRKLGLLKYIHKIKYKKK